MEKRFGVDSPEPPALGRIDARVAGVHVDWIAAGAIHCHLLFDSHDDVHILIGTSLRILKPRSFEIAYFFT